MLFPALGFPPSSNRDRGLEGTNRNTREQKGKPGPTSTYRRTPASQHDAADPAAQKSPSGHCDPPSTTKRPLGRNVRRVDPKSARSASSSGSGPQRAPPRKGIQSILAPSTRLNECVEMTQGQICGRP